MLWTLLVAISSLTFPIGTVLGAHRLQSGATGYVILAPLGLAFMVSNFLGLNALARTVVEAWGDEEDRLERRLRFVYAAAMVWAFVAAALAQWIASGVVRMVQ